MSKTLRSAAAAWMLGAAVAAASCLGGPSQIDMQDAGPDQSVPTVDSGHPDAKADAKTDAKAPADATAPTDAGGGEAAPTEAGLVYTLIDDMETTTHGPIEYAGVQPPLTPGYWFNFGSMVVPPDDTADPPLQSFVFTALPSPTTTRPGVTSLHAAHQQCVLHGLYDVCGLGFEFAQMVDLDAGDASLGATSDASLADAGDAGPPLVTIPFDISHYKGIVFWGKAASDDGGAVDVKVQFPDTETDPRGGVCNGVMAGASGPNDFSACYNSYAVHEMFTGDWQPYTVLFSDLMIDPSFGYQLVSPWDGKKIYGTNWQGQKNTVPDASPETIDFWVDDVYFIQ